MWLRIKDILINTDKYQKFNIEPSSMMIGGKYYWYLMGDDKFIAGYNTEDEAIEAINIITKDLSREHTS